MPRVLVVDDEPDIVDSLKDALTFKGYAVSTASDGPEALQKVVEDRPHVVLLDINMPTMNGLEVLRRIREVDPVVGVIMLSAVHQEETIQAALNLGAADFLTKPMGLQDIERSLALAQDGDAGSPAGHRAGQGRPQDGVSDPWQLPRQLR